MGDNCTDADITQEVKKFQDGAVIFLKEVEDPKRFGIAQLDQSNSSKVIGIEEKPNDPKSNLAVTGVYIYDKNVFSHINKIKPSPRGQLEITDVNNIYISEGKLNWANLTGFWSDAGTFESLYRSSVYWARKALKEKEKELTTY